MRTTRTPRRICAAGALAAVLFAALPVQASIFDYVGECVPFAREASGIQIWGDAWTWWDQAKGRYARGYVPKVGSVIVFARSGQLPLGHVAVVSRIVEKRVLMLTHANWSRQNGERGHVERDVTLFDVSARGDWSEVRVWYKDNDGLGGSTYPVYGFIYGTPDRDAPDGLHRARPTGELSAKNPDYVGSLIDAYAR